MELSTIGGELRLSNAFTKKLSIYMLSALIVVVVVVSNKVCITFDKRPKNTSTYVYV